MTSADLLWTMILLSTMVQRFQKPRERASSLPLIRSVHCKLYVTIKKEIKSQRKLQLRLAPRGDLDVPGFQALSFIETCTDTQLLSQRKWRSWEIWRRSTLGLCTSSKSLDFSKFDPQTIQLVMVESRRSLFQTHEQMVFPVFSHLLPSMCQILQLRSHAQQ